MKKLSLWVVLTIFASIPVSFAQSHSELLISKSFESNDEKTEPAIGSLTIPAGQPSSFLINGGVGYELTWIKVGASGENSYKKILSPFVVGNYNNLVTDKQRNYKAGGNFSLLIGKNTSGVDESGLIRVFRTNYFSMNHTIEYVRDLETPTHSLVYTLYLTQELMDNRKGHLNINKYHGEGKWQTFIGYNAGFELQDHFQADDPALKGYNFRNYHNGILRLALRAPDPDTARRRASTNTNTDPFVPLTEIGVSYVGRYQLAGSTANNEGYLPLFKAEFILYPTRNENFSVGFSYNAGSDPLNGLANQHYYLLSLKFKTKKRYN